MTLLFSNAEFLCTYERSLRKHVFANFDPFEVISDHFLAHIGRYLSHNLTNIIFQVLEGSRFIHLKKEKQDGIARSRYPIDIAKIGAYTVGKFLS